MDRRSQLSKILILLFFGWYFLALLILFSLFGCGNITQSGYVRTGLYPRHNEAVDGLSDKVVKWRGEVSQSVRVNRVELVMDPVITLENRWPQGSTSYGFNTIMLETNIEGRIYLTEPIYIFYKKTDHRLLRNDDKKDCGCTYWNEVGIEVRW